VEAASTKAREDDQARNNLSVASNESLWEVQCQSTYRCHKEWARTFGCAHRLGLSRCEQCEHTSNHAADMERKILTANTDVSVKADMF
jgi:hypothetical protein